MGSRISGYVKLCKELDIMVGSCIRRWATGGFVQRNEEHNVIGADRMSE